MNTSLLSRRSVAWLISVSSLALASTACSAAGGDSSDYAAVPGTGGEAGQLDFTGDTRIGGGASSAQTPPPVDIGVSKAEALVYPDCTHPIGGVETCNDGKRPVPIDVTATCDERQCTVDVLPGGAGATLRIQLLSAGDKSVRVHAARRGGGEAWDDTVVVRMKEAKKAVGVPEN